MTEVPVIRVQGGVPTAEELAAVLVALLASRAVPPGSTAPAQSPGLNRPRSEWRRSALGGPAAARVAGVTWRASGLPGR